MAPARKDDENLRFLFTCFQNSVKNSGKVDWKEVSAAHNINTGAASMRLTRIKKALESASEEGELDDKGNDDGTGVAPKVSKSPKTKRSQVTNGVATSAKVSKGKGQSKSKKRKLEEEEQVDALIQRAKVEALDSVKVEPEDEI